MAKKRHVTYTRLTGKHKKHYLDDKSFTIKPSEHNDEGNEIAELEFTAKKHMNKFHRNLKNGKGTRISPHELVDIKLHDGKGFFDSIKRGFQSAGDAIKSVVNNPTTKSIVKTITPIASNLAGNAVKQAVTNYTGNEQMGDLAGNLTTKGVTAGSNAYTGSGVKSVKGRSNVVLGGSFLPLGGSIKGKKGGAIKAVENLQQFTGISGAPGLDALNANQTRMAHIRSFIGQNRLS